MSTILITIPAFLLALGILVTIHEFGHFWVARKMGVKVITFSVGFGKSIKSWYRKGDETEYRLAAIPLGGYVKMLGEQDEEIADSEKHLSFANKSLGARAAIVAAGPVANLLFAILVLWVMYILGVPGYKPLVGEVKSQSLAEQGGLRQGDEIISVDGERTATLQSLRLILIDRLFSQQKADLMVKRGENEVPVSLDFTNIPLPDSGKEFEFMGIGDPIFPAVVGELVEGPAKRAGLQVGDRVVKTNGKSIQAWKDWVDIIQASPNQTMQVQVLRQGRLVDLRITPEPRQDDASKGQVGVLVESIRAIDRYGPIDALTQGAGTTWRLTLLTFKMIGKLLTGQAKLENLSGPIRIADVAGKTAQVGLSPYLFFLALVSISLGVINLLPIPVLDGGHLFMMAIEWVKGSPLSETAREHAQFVGLIILVMLMSIAFYNDIVSYF